ncbi:MULTISPECIES: alcohol dehydrogenase catalytic domain-containing protein [unclassified Aureimonas]|uniref:alcohol dehydrogenase catalytic domain-containing protein n=1 Tax=unclassified Aureimonas TaxID=2615206 RepID=UPI0006F59606|nr:MULTISPECIES: alcohol dehydrogenase catalytic domain-containing protein [unclassified Aureimonas]KQT57727.1 threonine dehydrogenase [Aureimonas sp. Leaf427]KQT75796.1 threonine dehydrogenase [Aureimonas sp. Leaf460]
MKAALLRAPNDVLFDDVADPVPERGDLVLRVRAATICGTDIRIVSGRKTMGVRYPSVLGHEFSGEIVDNGGSARFKVGDAVCVDPAIACGHCDYCRRGAENLCANLTAIGYELDGAFAEYVRIPSRALETGNVFPMPADISFEEAALAEPLACVLNGQDRVGVERGDVVAILGSGPIGLLHVKVARLSGASRIIVSEPNVDRRAAALAAGADIVVDPTSEDLKEIVRGMSGGIGADVVIVAIGVPSLANDALSLVRLRGRVSLFAGFSKGEMAALDVNAIHYNELIVTGSFGLTRLQFEKSLNLIASGQLDTKPFLTHRFALTAIGEALATAARGDAIKVAIVS